MSRYWVLDAAHEAHPAADIHEWGAFTDEQRNIAVGKDTIGDVFISTEFFGTDQRIGRTLDKSGPPWLYETMVFRGALDQRTWHWWTWDEAKAGHARIIEAVKTGADPGRDPR